MTTPTGAGIAELRAGLAALEREWQGLDMAQHHAESQGRIADAERLAARRVTLPGELRAARRAVVEGEIALLERDRAGAEAAEREAAEVESAAIDAERRAVADHREAVAAAMKACRDRRADLSAIREGLKAARARLARVAFTEEHGLV